MSYCAKNATRFFLKRETSPTRHFSSLSFLGKRIWTKKDFSFFSSPRSFRYQSDVSKKELKLSFLPLHPSSSTPKKFVKCYVTMRTIPEMPSPKMLIGYQPWKKEIRRKKWAGDDVEGRKGRKEDLNAQNFGKVVCLSSTVCPELVSSVFP